jgi:hypothetical protein
MLKSLTRKFVAGSVAIILSSYPIGSTKADPTTAYLVISTIQTGISLFGPKSPDLTAAMIKAQGVAIEQIHHRLDELEGSVSTLLTMVAVLPEEIQVLLRQNSEADLANTVKGTIGTLQSNLANLAELKKEGKKKAKEAGEHVLLTRITLNELRSERTALFEESDFALPYIIMAMNAEMATLSALPPIENEVSRALKAYDARIGKMLEETRTDSLLAIRADLENVQDEEAILIGKAVSGKQELVEGTWPWYSHTLVGNRKEICSIYHREIRGPDFYELSWVEKVPCSKRYDVHTRLWKRKLIKQPLQNSAGIELYSISLNPIEPTGDDEIVVPKPKNYRNGNKEFLKVMKDAEKPLRVQVGNFNNRAKAIQRVIELEQLATFARILIAKWDVVDSSRLLQAADVAGKAKISTLLNQIEQNKRNEEARSRIEGMSAARETAWKEIRLANEELNTTIKQAKNNAWTDDVKFILDVYRFSYQVTEVSQRFEIFSDNPPDTAHKEALKKLAKAPSNEGRAIASNEVINKVASLGLSDDEKAKLILQILKKVKPAESWGTTPLPSISATLPETQIAYAATLLDSMASAQLPSINESYEKALADAGGGKIELLVAALLPTPVSSGTFSDDQSRQQMRKQINALARGYAKRRLNESVKLK